MAIKLGSEVKDVYTGFSGVATGRTEYLYGCTRVLVEPRELHEGKPIDGQWFDEQRIELVTESAPKVSADSSAGPGGPQRDPQRRPKEGGRRC